MPLDQVRALFQNGTKVCMAVGGWADTEGFGVAAASEESRKLFAENVAKTADKLGYDCVGTSIIPRPLLMHVKQTNTMQILTGSIPAVTARTTRRTPTTARSPRLRRTLCCSRRSRPPSATRSFPLLCPVRRAT